MQERRRAFHCSADRLFVEYLSFCLSEELSWTVVVEEKRDLLERAVVVHGNTILLHYMRDVVSALEVRDLETAKIRGEIPLELGTVSTVSGRRKYSHLFFSFTSFTTPSIIYEADLSNETSQPDAWTPKVYRETKVGRTLPRVRAVAHREASGRRSALFSVLCWSRLLSSSVQSESPAFTLQSGEQSSLGWHWFSCGEGGCCRCGGGDSLGLAAFSRSGACAVSA